MSGVIVGGASGPGDVSVNADNAVQCGFPAQAYAGRAVLVKQMARIAIWRGERLALTHDPSQQGDPGEWPPALRVRQWPDGERVLLRGPHGTPSGLWPAGPRWARRPALCRTDVQFRELDPAAAPR